MNNDALTERARSKAAVIGCPPGLKPGTRSVSAHLFEREDHDRADGRWLEPFDGDTAAERDAWWHADYGTPEDW